MNINHFGTLYVVATPIGNLQDMSPRAIKTLKSVDYIAAEDTRHSAPLLQHFMINTKTIALHEHNERERTVSLLEHLKQGQSIALISDAGTPLINDPGYFLTREAQKAGVRIIPIPGPSAVITALSVSGLPTDKFCYQGFLPSKSKHRIRELELLQNETRTMVFYEAPHRVLESLQDMSQIFGSERHVVLARELTKMYETIHAATFSELIDWIKNDENQQRGEIVLVVRGNETAPVEKDTISLDHILKTLLTDLPLKQAVEIASKITGKRKNEVYQKALQIKSL